MKEELHITTKLFQWPRTNNVLYLISIPKEISTRVHEQYNPIHRGWNSLKVRVTIGHTTWDTSMFFDRKSTTYLLPIKAHIRKTEMLLPDDEIQLQLSVI